MRAFLDTSTLVKKYVEEKGSRDLERLLETVSELCVAPIYFLELRSALKNKAKHGEITSKEEAGVLTEARRDLTFFSVVKWNETLEDTAVTMIERHALRAMDSIQLAAGILARADIFVTSDLTLYRIVNKILKQSLMI